MSKKIEKLTPEQEALLPVYRQKWLDIGLSTEKLNKELATAAVHEMYTCAGEEIPKEIVFVNGPIEAYRLLKDRKYVSTASEYLSSVVYGSYEAGWLAFYNFFQEVCGLKECDPLNGLFNVAKHCGWVSVFDDLAVVCEKPLHIKLDEDYRLHSENGPAVLFRDTFSVYVWHGVRIPPEWIRDKSLTPEIALTWNNMEQRRAACELLGWANILDSLNSKVIDMDEDPQIGTLLQVELPDLGTEQFLKVVCGTGRTFAIPVPPDVKTALEANAWTYGVDPSELRELEVRT